MNASGKEAEGRCRIIYSVLGESEICFDIFDIGLIYFVTS